VHVGPCGSRIPNSLGGSGPGATLRFTCGVTYAGARMTAVLVTLLHLVGTAAKLCGPAESARSSRKISCSGNNSSCSVVRGSVRRI